MKRKKYILLAVILCIVIVALTACGDSGPAQSVQSVPYEETVVQGDFEITFSVSGSVYDRESGEGLTCELEIKYVGEEPEVTVYHAGVPFQISVNPKPSRWPEFGVADILAHTVFKSGESYVYTDVFPWDWSEKKIEAGEYTLVVWVDFHADPKGKPEWENPMFEVPIIVQ